MIKLLISQREARLIQAGLEILLETSELNEVAIRAVVENLKADQEDIRPLMEEDLKEMVNIKKDCEKLLTQRINPLVIEDGEIELLKPHWEE